MIPRRFLVTSNFSHVSRYSLLAMERAFEAEGLHGISVPHGEQIERATKAMSRLGLIRNVRRDAEGPVICACMGFSEFRTVPLSYWTELVPYCFDCWPSAWPRWEAFFRRQRTRLAFFSAQQSAEHFAQVLPAMKSIWLPEATDPLQYDPSKPLVERQIDVLELGRRNEPFHAHLVKALAADGRVHLYEKVKGEIIFPTAADLWEGLGTTKISVCFPSSQTHPERSGVVETVTHRYFESIASKCVLLGFCPKELKELFGYNPVVETEEGSELEQVRSILADVASYQPLVERNYQRLLEVGTWPPRIQTMLAECESVFRE